MAKMFPELTELELRALPSSGEATLYRACRDNLPGDFEVYFSVGWIMRRPDAGARDGEADFVICHRDLGFLTIEVKGGGISYDATRGEWFSVDRSGETHKIKDPVRQARTAKYSILAKLREHPRWGTGPDNRILCGHAVFFPDIGDIAGFRRPDLPGELIGSSSTINHLPEWIHGAFHFWDAQEASVVPLGPHKLTLFREVFARSFELKPPLSHLLAVEEDQRIRLTRDQARVLDLLQSRRRVAVSGGAGTGKTVLAVEKAKRLAGQGFSTLLTCYNQQLAKHLADACSDIDNLSVMSFHQLCRRRVTQADKVSGRNLLGEAKISYPGAPEWEVQWPAALSYTADIIPETYDAIVCDEGQDFGEEWWLPLEILLTDSENSPLYVFFDDNQKLYARSAAFPIVDEPFTLTHNCRNTDRIHEAAYAYYRGVPVEPPDISGVEIQRILSTSLESQAKKLHAHIVELISKDGVRPGDVAVLIADSLRKGPHYEAIRHLPLPGGASWLEEGQQSPERVLLETVKRFKGLEAPIVFLWGLDTLDIANESELLYVGMSRAKSVLGIVGKPETTEQILSP